MKTTLESLRTPATEAALSNAHTWATEVAPGKPYIVIDGEEWDDIHIGTICSCLNRDEDDGITDEEHAILWPIYRDALVAEVDRLIASKKGGA